MSLSGHKILVLFIGWLVVALGHIFELEGKVQVHQVPGLVLDRKLTMTAATKQAGKAPRDYGLSEDAATSLPNWA